MLNIRVEKYETIISALGNILEWYCFALFMPFLHVISGKFFPLDNLAHSNILSFLALSVGLFVRPFGAVVFGPMGDKFGRTKAISFSILLMAIPTVCIGTLPDYKTIGIAAPILLIFFRALQGISMGGEYTVAMVHLVEQAPNHRRGFYGSWSDAGTQIGVLIGGQFLVLLYNFFSEAEIYAFAWRIPFLLGVVLIPFAFLVPKHDMPKKCKPKEPILKMLSYHKKAVSCTIAITAFSSVGFYTLLTFLPYYLISENILTLREATLCSVSSNVIIFIAILCAGFLSDIYTRKPFMILGMIGVCSSMYLMFILNVKSFNYWLILHLLYGFFIGTYYSSRSAFFAESFPVQVRCTAVSISLSLAQAVFGGLTPVVMNYFTYISGFLAVIPITIVTTFAICAVLLMEDRTGKELM